MGEAVRLVTSAATLRVSLAVVIWLTVSNLTPAADNPSYSLRWNTNSNQTVVEVTGIPTQTLQPLSTANWQSADWQKLFSVYANQGDLLADMAAPAMLGNYSVQGNLVRFQPKFPLERGVVYRAVFRPAKLPGGAKKSPADIISQFQLAVAHDRPTTVVTQIFPSSDVLPANLLKFYVHFSAPMQGGHIYDHIHILDEAGKPVELPFLEIDEELWNREMTRLTLFIDPGRIKRGVKPLEEIGPALEEGRRYTLTVDATWRDHASLPLRESFRKSFRVGTSDREPPNPVNWKITPPKAGTRDTLIVNFSEPMDHALALRVIRVASPGGRLVEGDSVLSDREQRWNFTPQQPWTPGRHQLQVQNTIEDLAGNNIGKAFEVDLFEGVQRRFTNQVVRLSFEVR